MTGSVMMRATAAACLGALLAAAPLSPVAERGVAMPSAAAKGGGGGGSEHGGGHGGGAGGGASGGGSGSGGGQGAGRGGEHATSGATSGGTAQNGHGGRQSGGGSHDGRHAGGWGHDWREISIAGRGALNATHASATARGHAAPNSRVGQIATYDRSMSRALAMPTATPAQRAAQREAIAAARGQLAAAGNKPPSPTVIGWVDDRLGLAPTSHGQGGR